MYWPGKGQNTDWPLYLTGNTDATITIYGTILITHEFST